MERNLVLTALTCLTCCMLQAQPLDKPVLHFADALPRIAPGFLRAAGSPAADAVFRDKFLLLVQFSGIPDEDSREAMAHEGVILHDYLGNFAYSASLPIEADLEPFGVQAVYKLDPDMKCSPFLRIQLREEKEREQAAHADVLVRLFPGIAMEEAMLQHFPLHWGVEQTAPFLRVRLPFSEVLQLASYPWVYALEAWPVHLVWEGAGAQALHQAAMRAEPGIPGLDGSGVTVVFPEDGFPEHTDFQGRLINLHNYIGTHAPMTLGMAIGGGHIQPLAAGIAPSARGVVMPIDGYAHLHRAAEWYAQYRAVLSSNAFGEGNGGFYSNHAAFLDESSALLPKVGHIFSAGNNGNTPSGNAYGHIRTAEGAVQSTISGGMKAAKNALTVGNIDAGKKLIFLSSRGPAADGRLKPELCAMGESDITPGPWNTYQLSRGTSAAAAVVTGIAALLYQDYRRMFQGQDPDFALIKTLLMATAEDLGRPGPDYDYGFGAVNAKAAVHALRSRQYMQGQVRHGLTGTHTIQVPAGVKQLKVMLYWPDAPASPLAAKALVNDLDLSVLGPDGKIILPLVLSAFPHADSLSKPAAPGYDRLNNAELVEVHLPQSGAYQIRVRGFSVPQGNQPYYVVYVFDEQPLEWVFPAGEAAFIPGETIRLRWAAAPQATAPFRIDYSVNGGASWQTIGQAPADTRFMDWVAPQLSGSALRFRVVQGNAQAMSGTHTLLSTPVFSLRRSGTQTIEVSWQKVQGASAYEVFLLEGGEMRAVAQTASTSYAIQSLSGGAQWISVRALAPEKGLTGRRALAQMLVLEVAQQVLSGQIDVVRRISCFGQRDGMLEVQARGGSGQYTYLWSTGHTGKQLGNLGAGAYQVTIRDGQNMVSLSYRLEQPTQLSASFQWLDPTCYQAKDGYIAGSASGGTAPYNWRWHTGSTQSALSALGAGQYAVTLTDSSGCALVQNVQLHQPGELSASIQIDSSSGRVRLSAVSGGTPPYQLNWSDGQRGEQPQTAFPPGDHSLTLTDSRGCSRSFAFTVPNPPQVVAAYCPARTTTSLFEWIERIQIGNFSHLSGNDGGYGDFVNKTIVVPGGAALTLELMGGFRRKAYPENWYVWADLNRDGDFDDPDELLFQASGLSEVEGKIAFPKVAGALSTRLRISMSFAPLASACDRISYGETEEYTLRLLPQEEAAGAASTPPAPAFAPGISEIRLYPNPVTDWFRAEWQESAARTLRLTLWNTAGAPAKQWTMDTTPGWNTFISDLNGLPSGVYLFDLDGIRRLIVKK